MQIFGNCVFKNLNNQNILTNELNKGGVFSLQQAVLIDNGSTYTYINAKYGGIYYLVNSTLQITNSTFKNVKSLYGGISYSSSLTTASPYNYSQCTFSNVSSG
jgi:hypothetical protein